MSKGLTRFNRLTLKLTLAAVVFALLTSGATELLLTYGFQQTGQSATDLSRQGLERQGREALLNLTLREAQVTAVQLSEAARAGQTAARYLVTMAQVGGRVPWDVSRRLSRAPSGQYWDPDPARGSDVFIPRSVTIGAPQRRDLRDSAALDAVFPALLAQVPNGNAIYYISPRGVTRYYPQGGLSPLIPPDYPILRSASYTKAAPASDPAGITVWRAPYIDPQQQGLLVTASTPVYAGTEFRGVIGVDVALAGLIYHLDTLQPTPTGYAFLVDRDDRLIAAPPSPAVLGDLVGRAALPPAISPTTMLNLSLAHTPAAGLRQTLGAMRGGQQGVNQIQLGGRTVFLSYAPLPGLGWSLGLVAPIGEITAQSAAVATAISTHAEQTAWSLLAAFVALFAFVLCATLLLSRWLLARPLEVLTTATRAIAAGDLTVTIPATRSDELGQLARSFNTMGSELVRLVHQQQEEARERERIAQELQVARLIQQTLLPQTPPALPGWQVAAHYQPAREVGGDFYDFLDLPDGRLGLIIGDVTDKGVPAALVMATTRSILRAAAQHLLSPGQVLERANDLLCPDIPPNMFATCLYAILDPATGQLQYANAGHNLPYLRHGDGVSELRATGMPLGLMPGMCYEEKSATLLPGENVLLYSDGLVEAHNRQRDMFGFPRLRSLMAAACARDGAALIPYLLAELERFTGAEWEQEDDITLVTLQRCPVPAARPPRLHLDSAGQSGGGTHEGAWRTVAEWTVPSEPGNERVVMERVAAVAQDVGLPVDRLERLKTAVSEATMNAIEHGNQNRPEVPVSITVRASPVALAVRIADQGGGRPIPEPTTPDLDAKLAGLQTPRGWGLYLIKNLVDEMHIGGDATQHTIELILYLEGDQHGRETL